MKNLTDALTYTAAVRVVENLDDVDGPNSEATAQDLANRTAYLKDQAESSGTRYKSINILNAKILSPTDSGVLGLGGGVYAISMAANGLTIPIPLELPPGVTLTQLSFVVYQANAGSDGRMSVKLWKVTNNSDSGASTQIGATTFGTAGVGYTTIALGSLSEVISYEAKYTIEVIASLDAGTNSDHFVFVLAIFTDPRSKAVRW